MTPTETPPAKFILWQRSRSRRWKAIASAASEAELTAKLANLSSGDYCSLPLNQDPNIRPRASRC